MFRAIGEWLLDKAKDYFLRNWKTTLIGVLGAVLSRYIPNITPDQQAAIVAAVMAALGIFSKDADKTGTVAQPREAVQPAPVPDAVIIDMSDTPPSAHSGP